ncbi:hypothetical protein BGAL_0261g00040 [Botrytis galanthina]|uniref:Uncharacterized protein n=1 Tax=Botrytis galanthina TaxID=278940 RepID=A0A4S8R4V6_9HELO|nr:hypothetical protein BGAL_0261g00040 [Botrytis galanthina]
MRRIAQSDVPHLYQGRVTGKRSRRTGRDYEYRVDLGAYRHHLTWSLRDLILYSEAEVRVPMLTFGIEDL